MGFAICRFNEKAGCYETGSSHYNIILKDLNILIDVPEMWKHYMTEHLVQPNENERVIVMSANPEQVLVQKINTRSLYERVQVLYVEKEGDKFTHQVGTKPDYQFIEKLEKMLSNENKILNN